MLSRKLLVEHHEATVSCDSIYFDFLVKIFNSLDKLCFNFWRHLAGLAHCKSESWDHPIENVVAETVFVIDISRSWWVIVL